MDYINCTVAKCHAMKLGNIQMLLFNFLLVSCTNFNSMEQSFYWEANPSSASQEIPCILWKPKLHDRPRNSLL